METKKLLITGANGQLGQELARRLQGQADVLYTDADTLDITDEQAVQAFFRENSIGACINAAAYTAVDNAEDQPEMAEAINATAPGHLAKACHEQGAWLFQVSTDFVFDGAASRPLKVGALTAPLSVYGQTKKTGEDNALRFNPQGTLVVRTAWLYSPFGKNFIKTVLRLAETHQQLTIVADQTGTPTHAGDLADALLTMYDRLGKHPNPTSLTGIYHFSNEGVATWYDVACAVLEYASIDKEVLPIRTEDFPAKAPRPAYSVLDKSKIRETFGLKIPHWRSSLKPCVEELVDEQVSP